MVIAAAPEGWALRLEEQGKGHSSQVILALGYRQDGLLYGFGAFRKLLLAKFKFGPVKINIAHVVNRYQMDVSMGYFKANHRYANPFAGVNLFNALCNDFGKNPKSHVFIISNIKQVVGFPFGDDQHMSFGQGIDI